MSVRNDVLKYFNDIPQKLSSLTPEEFEELYKSVETIKKVSLEIQGSEDE
ncbi:MAG: hypothetical protein ACLPWD_05690 [Methanobacterium sp.]